MKDEQVVNPNPANGTTGPVQGLLQSLRHSGLPLNEQLARVSQAIEEFRPQYTLAYDELIARLKRAQTGEDAPQAGDAMPNFLLPDESGHLVSLEKLRQDGPVVVAFLRGHWCSYCRLNAAALADLAPEIKPAQIIAITTEKGKFAKALRDDSGAQFPFLTDMGSGYSLMLGLAFALGDELASLLHANALNIPAFQGTAGWVLPIPALFVVGRDGLIKARYVNPDFRQRMEIDALRSAVTAALTGDGGPIGST